MKFGLWTLFSERIKSLLEKNTVFHSLNTENLHAFQTSQYLNRYNWFSSHLFLTTSLNLPRCSDWVNIFSSHRSTLGTFFSWDFFSCGRQWMLFLENFPQAVLALIFLWIQGGSLIVTFLEVTNSLRGTEWAMTIWALGCLGYIGDSTSYVGSQKTFVRIPTKQRI